MTKRDGDQKPDTEDPPPHKRAKAQQKDRTQRFQKGQEVRK